MNKTFTATMLCLAAASVYAEPANLENQKYFDSREMGISLGQAKINSTAAQQAGVGQDIQFANFYLQGQKDSVLVAAGIGFINFDDKDSISQRVERNGSVSTETSSASGLSLNLEGGFRYNVSIINLDMLAGIEYFKASRKIENCTDCSEEDIEIDSGLYFKPRISAEFTPKFGMDLSYSVYTSSDLENSLALSATFSY